MVVVANQEPQSLQAQLTYKEVNAVGLRNVIEQLVGLDADGNLYGMLANSWEQIDDTTWRFELREGVSFHDGSPFNAESAEISIEWVWDEGNAFTIRELAGPNIDVVPVSEYVINIKTAEPDPLLPQRMYLAGIGSAKQIQEDSIAHDHTPIGTGPYIFEAWNRGQDWTMTANPDWWGITAEDAYGEQYFERVTVQFRSETQVRAAAVQSGEADIAMFISDSQCGQFDEDPDLQCFAKTSDTYVFFRLDYTGAHPSLSDPRVREAVYLAIDNDGIVSQIMGLGEPLEGQLLPKIAMGAVDSLEDYGYDPDRARMLIDEAKADGIEIPSIHIAARVGSTPRNDQIIEAIGFFLNEVGIETTVALEEPAIFNEWVTTRPTEVRASAWIHPMQNPLMDNALIMKANYSCVSVVSVYCNEDLDAKANAASQLVGDDRDQALQELVQFVHDERIVNPIAMVARAYGTAAGLNWEFGIDHRIIAVDMSY
jgi:peptide/nickel transport system substrate-binding protein